MAPGTGDPRAPRAVGRLHNWLGFAAGFAVSRRQVGEAGLAGRSGFGGVMARLAGYAERHPVRAKVLRMTAPELMLTLELGGSAVSRDAAAVERGVSARHGVAAGASGVANIGAGFASPGRVGVYVQVRVGQRFSARSNSELEGAHYVASAGPGVGLRVAGDRRWTALIGGGLDGVLGVQRLDRSRLIGQLAPAVELALYSQPRPRVYFGVVGRGDGTAVGARHGGRRLHGRASAEVVWQLPRGPARFAGVLLVYEGGRVEAGAGHPQFAAAGERRGGHHLLLAGGVTF